MNANLTLPFPSMPADASREILNPSVRFKNNVYRSIGAIALFIIVYLLLLVGAVGIAFTFGAIGVLVMRAEAAFLTLVLGIALICSGLMLVYFVIKFLFKRSGTDYSGMIEITEEDQPRLFNFIRQLTVEANAPFPKRIFLSADVNASVFYDSSFWSMFFPVKKNLKIGLGLINSLNISEFKAVMAHEFGHFSQRSMKFGSYIYNLNKIIYDMLYENEGYGRLLNTFSRFHSIFKLAATINVQIIKGIQYVLKQVYVIVNKSYLSLSREMEFHADAMAAYVSGSNHLITSLKRIEIGQVCYNELLHYWEGQLAKNNRADNFYPQHSLVIKYYNEKHNLKQDKLGLPVINNGSAAKTNVSEIIIDDQWSSHPSTHDRESRLLGINLNTPTVDTTAWALFDQAERLQVMLTDDIYSRTQANSKTVKVGAQLFDEQFSADINAYALDKIYGGFYDGRSINTFDVDAAIAAGITVPQTFEQLFTESNINLPVSIDRMQQDITTLEGLSAVKNDIKTFDHRGVRYSVKNAAEITQCIEDECLNATNKLKDLDKRIFIYFYKMDASIERKAELAAGYKKLFALQEDSMTDYDLYGNMMASFNKVYDTMPFEQIYRNLDDIYNKERRLKARINEVLADEHTRSFFSAEQLNAVEQYAAAKLVYFLEPDYDHNAINTFNEGVGAYISAIFKRNFAAKKYVLNLQAEMLKAANVTV